MTNKHQLVLTPLFLIFLLLNIATAQTDPNQPNILLVIADDLGVDYLNGYHNSTLLPTTPTLDSLRSVGITFENVFATPKCATSRATMMSGKFGINNGVETGPGNLDLSHESIFKALKKTTNNDYTTAAIGKWHISQPIDANHALDHGADYFLGVMGSGVDDYYKWQKTTNGTTTTDSNYVTSVFTDTSIDWINDQVKPWFLWMAHVAPHSPFHVPPQHMYSITNTQNNARKYVAMIESVDFELNRLLKSIPKAVRENTLIIFVGDNGTPSNLIQDYPAGHGKGTLYQGGVRVPLIVTGPNVERKGEHESEMIQIADIYATILEYTKTDLPGGIYNSLSFNNLLSKDLVDTRNYNYTEYRDMGVYGWAIRNKQYKLISYDNGEQEFYDLLIDSLETTDLLLSTLTSDQLELIAEFESESNQIRTAWSCQDSIQNGTEEDIDCGGLLCNVCTTATKNIAHVNTTIYPNPNASIINITSDAIIQKIIIYNTRGVIILSEKHPNASTTSINIESLANGIYYINVVTHQGISTDSFIKI